MIMLDVNVLVHLHREDADKHLEYRNWFEGIVKKGIPVALSELVLSGCLRVITHPKIFKIPTSVIDACEFIEEIRSFEAVHILKPGEKHWEIFIDLCRRTEAKGNFIPDAYHAALAMEQRCEWMTLDRGFSRFPGLRWKHPLE